MFPCSKSGRSILTRQLQSGFARTFARATNGERAIRRILSELGWRFNRLKSKSYGKGLERIGNEVTGS